MPSFSRDAYRRGGAASAKILPELARRYNAPIVPVVVELHRQGLSLRKIAAELDRRSIKPRNARVWSAAQVRLLLKGAGITTGAAVQQPETAAPESPVSTIPPPGGGKPSVPPAASLTPEEPATVGAEVMEEWRQETRRCCETIVRGASQAETSAAWSRLAELRELLPRDQFIAIFNAVHASSPPLSV